jgi:hypothetical protein
MLGFVLSPSILDRQVLALNPTKVAQPLAEGLDERPGSRVRKGTRGKKPDMARPSPYGDRSPPKAACLPASHRSLSRIPIAV